MLDEWSHSIQTLLKKKDSSGHKDDYVSRSALHLIFTGPAML